MGFFIGAVIATFLLSRLVLWLGRKWIASPSEIVAAHAISLAVIFVGAGFGAADGGPFRTDAVLTYLIPWSGWLIFDLVRRDTRLRRDEANGEKKGPVIDEGNERDQ
jgi:hypothetical protein